MTCRIYYIGSKLTHFVIETNIIITIRDLLGIVNKSRNRLLKELIR